MGCHDNHPLVREYEEYPLNYESPHFIKSVLGNYKGLLDEQSDRLFMNSESKPKFPLMLWDAYKEQNGQQLLTSGGKYKVTISFVFTTSDDHAVFIKQDIPNATKLIEVLQRHLAVEQEPLCRHVFIEAKSSRSVLECDIEVFKILGSFHQISPKFLDLLLSFGRQLDPVDFHHSFFYNEYVRKSFSSPRTNVPELQRSGCEMRLCYKVQALEKKMNTNDKGYTWNPRETAVYHSFDLSNGKSFWLTVKANKRISSRIRELSDQSCEANALAQRTPTGAFASSLRTHLTIIEWCTEGWRFYIHETEKALRKIFAKVKVTPVDQVNDFSAVVRDLVKRTSGTNKISHNQRTDSNMSAFTGFTGLKNQFSSHSKKDGNLMNSSNEKSPSPENSKALTQAKIDEKAAQTENILDVLKEFNVEEMQQINQHTSKLHEFKMSMTLNAQILGDIRRHYQSLVESSSFQSDMKKSCQETHDDFQDRIRMTEGFFRAECLRIDTLIALAEECKQLYDWIVQFHNSQVNNLFALTGKDVSENMNELAKRTERDTRSMHIITFFTLVFLPGTFLGTFFSTPIFDSDGAATWEVNKGLFYLFLKICLPMMVVTILVWGGYMWLQTRRSKRGMPLGGPEAA